MTYVKQRKQLCEQLETRVKRDYREQYERCLRFVGERA